jgi:hypothetical protein
MPLWLLPRLDGAAFGGGFFGVAFLLARLTFGNRLIFFGGFLIDARIVALELVVAARSGIRAAAARVGTTLRLGVGIDHLAGLLLRSRKRREKQEREEGGSHGPELAAMLMP